MTWESRRISSDNDTSLRTSGSSCSYIVPEIVPHTGRYLSMVDYSSVVYVAYWVITSTNLFHSQENITNIRSQVMNWDCKRWVIARTVFHLSNIRLKIVASHCSWSRQSLGFLRLHLSYDKLNSGIVSETWKCLWYITGWSSCIVSVSRSRVRK